MKKSQNICRKLIYLLLLMVMAFISITILFLKLYCPGTFFEFALSTDYITDYIPNLLIFGIFLVLSVLSVFLVRKKSSHKNSHPRGLLLKKTFLGKLSPKRQFLIWGLLLFALELFLLYNLYFLFGRDTNAIRIAAENFVGGTLDEEYNLTYFQGAPNNLGLYFFHVLLYKIAAPLPISGYALASIVGCCFVSISAYLVALCLYTMTGKVNTARLGFFLFAAIAGISPWTYVPYTDTLAMPFPILTFYIYLRLKDKKMSPFVKWFCIGILPFITYHLKALNLIVLIGIILCELLTREYKKGFLKSLLQPALALALCFILSKALLYGIRIYLGVERNEALELSCIWYYLALGISTFSMGAWNPQVVNMMREATTMSQRRSAFFDYFEYFRSVKDPVEYLKLYINKTQLFYNDGTYGWGHGTDAYHEVFSEPTPLAGLLRNIFYNRANYGITSDYVEGYGSYYLYYAGFAQIVWLFCLFGTIGFLIFSIKKGPGYCHNFCLGLIFLGLFFFFMLFETSSRLIFSYLPFFALMGALFFHMIRSRSNTP